MSGVIAVKRKGFILPESFAGLTLQKFKSCMGAAMVKDGKLQIEKGAGTVAVADVQETCEHFKDQDMVMHFAGYPEGFPDADIQPFPMWTGKDGEHDLVAFLEGQFGHLVKPESAHSGAYHASMKLQPMLAQMIKENDGDVDKVLEHLKGTVGDMAMTSLYRDEGAVTLVSKTGKILSFHNLPSYKEFPWGWTTDTLGYDEEPVAGVEKPKMFGGLRNKLAGKTSVPTTAVDKGEVITEKKITELPVRPETSSDGKQLSAPPQHYTNKQKIHWYQKNEVNSQVPKNFKSCPEVELKPAVIKDFQELGKQLAKASGTDTAAKPDVESNKVFKPFSKGDAKPIASTEPVAQPVANKPPTESVNVRILDAKQKQEIDEFLKDGITIKLLDLHSKRMKEDPAKFQEAEKLMPSFFEQTGIHPEAAIRWPFQLFRKLGSKNMDYLANLSFSAYRTIEKQAVEIASLTALLETATASPPEKASHEQAVRTFKPFRKVS